jgi:APA family basic amino acid/polyamine antiporter
LFLAHVRICHRGVLPRKARVKRETSAISEILVDGVTRPSLVRAIGRWSLTAGVINAVIGSGIFGLPSAVANLVGPWSPLAVLIAGCSLFIVILCFAEVGSRFDVVGGPYLYAREAFGPAVGFQIGWLQICSRLLSGAAALNILVAYLGLLVPEVGTPLGRALTMTASVVLVTAINIVGVRSAAWTVNVFTVAKLIPLALLILLGMFHLRSEVIVTQVVSSSNWREAILLLVFAYGGFENAVIAASETRNPKGHTAFALVTSMATVTLVYVFVQLAVIGVLPHAAASTTPIASALSEILGVAGSTIGSVAVIVSVYGWLTGFALMTPRIVFSMAERDEMPSFLAFIHHRFRTPHVAIAINSAVVLALSLYSSFAQAATFGAIARLCVLGSTCAALIPLRAQSREPAPFQLPYGRLFAITGVAFCAWLLVTRTFTQMWILLAIIAAGTAIYVAMRNRRR